VILYAFTEPSAINIDTRTIEGWQGEPTVFTVNTTYHVPETLLYEDDFDKVVTCHWYPYPQIRVHAGVCKNEKGVTLALLHQDTLEMDRFLEIHEYRQLYQLSPLIKRLRYGGKKARSARRRLKMHELGRLYLSGYRVAPISDRDGES
jgi:hypothetical protein